MKGEKMFVCYLLSLCDQLGSIEFSNYRFQNLITDGGQDFLIIIQSQLSVNYRQGGRVRPWQNSERDVDHLQILWSSWRRDLPWSWSDVVDDGVLEPGDPEVQTLCEYVLLHAADPIEHDRPVATLHCHRKQSVIT